VEIDSEATHSFVRAAPGRVFARLARCTKDGRQIRSMHVEFTPAQALQMARHLTECARIAIAVDGPAPLGGLAFDPSGVSSA
jgi:acyl-coenzyme A thioesterase PaaI-like protein